MKVFQGVQTSRNVIYRQILHAIKKWSAIEGVEILSQLNPVNRSSIYDYIERLVTEQTLLMAATKTFGIDIPLIN